MSSKAPAPDRAADRVSRLTERERAVLRLLARGHDGKSAARELGISLTAVHERLREARGKLDVASSREAARLLAAAESDPDFRVDPITGVGAELDPVSPRRAAQRRLALVGLGGLAMIGIGAGAFALWVVGSAGEGAYAPPPAGAPPHVVRTVPAQGARIAPGPFTLSVTFDQPMQAGNYSFVQASAQTFPECRMPPALSPDRRTYRLSCMAAAGRRYEIWFNSGPYMNFKADSGLAAKPYQLLFSAGSR